jgi:ABC-2 type transport system permease protein
MIRGTALLFVNELRLLVKDRQALALLFIMPLALVIFLTLALHDVYLDKIGRNIPIRLVGPADTSECSEAESVCGRLRSELERLGHDVTIATATDRRGGSLRGGIAIVLPTDPAGLVDVLRRSAGGDLPSSSRIRLVYDPALDHSVRAMVQGHVLLALQTILIELAADEVRELVARGDLPKLSGNAIPRLTHFEGLVSEEAAGGFVLPNPVQQGVPAWALFGMFFIVIPIAASQIRDRENGIFRRLLSFPVPRASLLVGKLLAYLLINVVQFLLMFEVGTRLLPMLTGSPMPIHFRASALAAVTLAAAAAATSYGLMISSLARTAEQSSAFGSLSVVILAVLGGVMVPMFVMPPFMQTIAHISPIYWGIEAYQDVILRQAAFSVVAGKIAILLAFAAVFALISILRFRWSEV